MCFTLFAVSRVVCGMMAGVGIHRSTDVLMELRTDEEISIICAPLPYTVTQRWPGVMGRMHGIASKHGSLLISCCCCR